MNLFLFQSPGKKPDEHIISHLFSPNFEATHHTNEDSEFTTHSVRSTDQPLVYTEGCIAAGCPEDLW
jgi:hypothetical protein